MLTRVGDRVLVHQSEFAQTNTVVVEGRAGVLLIDPGVTTEELGCLAHDLHELARPVTAGFSTHPHWDHLLWHAAFGAVPRYATRRCVTAVTAWLSQSGAKARIAESGLIPPELTGRVPLDLLGELTALPTATTESTRTPWDGPEVVVIEHQAHAPGHAALLIKELGVLIAGDMLSDILIPLLDSSAADPLEDHLAALEQLERASAGIDVVIPGHGSVGRAGELPRRVARDRAYLTALRDGAAVSDPRLGRSSYGRDWLPAIHQRQLERFGSPRHRPDPE